ncbi:MAG: Hpt domain-containing protein, partial [Candidatus Sulfotelmatobacter sp.]
MTNPPDERGAELRELFFETSQELLQALNEESLKLEKTPGDEEIVRSIRRTVHTLKGDSAACGLRELSELAHLFEDALTLESAAGHGALAEISFAAADVFAEMLAAYHSGGKMPATESLRKRINELTATTPAVKKTRRRKKSVEPARSTGKDWTDAEKRALAQAQAAGLGLYDIVVKIDPHCTMPIAARQLIQNAISGIGQVIVVRPDAKSPAASKQVQFVFATTQSQEQIAAKCHIPTIAGDIAVTLIEAPAAKAPKNVPQDAAPALEVSGSAVPAPPQVSASTSARPAPAEDRAPA